jgi:nucleoside-diphosphate-sugar epimerase
MPTAIVAGGNGLVGRALVDLLLQRDHRVLVLGTSEELHESLLSLKSSSLAYVKSTFTANESMDSFCSRLHNDLDIESGSVFYNLAWKAGDSLRTGGLSLQLSNVNVSCAYVRLAKLLGAKKFVAIGSFEELVAERIIEADLWLVDGYKRESNSYALAKITARQQCAFEAYCQKIDFCYSYLSVVIDKGLSTCKFVENSLRDILRDRSIDPVRNPELCNISSTEEIAQQLFVIGIHGINGTEYVLGTGHSATLQDYFRKFANLSKSATLITPHIRSDSTPVLLREKDFSINLLEQHTAYKCNEDPESLFMDIISRQ